MYGLKPVPFKTAPLPKIGTIERAQLAGPNPSTTPSFAPSVASIRPPDEAGGIARFPRPAIAGGLLNALLAALILAWWHKSFSLPSFVLFFVALAYVAVSALAAMATARHYWRRSTIRSRFTLRELAMTWGAAWVWAPAVVLLMWRDMYWGPLAAALAAALPACTARWLRVRAERAYADGKADEPVVRPIFAETLQPIPSDWRGAAIAVCLYLACAAYMDSDSLLACGAAAYAAFLFAGQRAAAFDGRAETLASPRRVQMRFVVSVALAVLATMLVLIPGKPGSGSSVDAVAVVNAAKAAKKPGVHGIGGLGDYQSIVLWPAKPEKQLILPPDLLPASPLTKQQTLDFSGVYWYFEAPAEEPGPHAHVAHGNPMDVSIRTVNARPLMMEAHQKLARRIRLSSVREIAVTMRNRDNEPGRISIGVVLTDSAYEDKDGLNLGMQPLASSEPEHFAIKTAPVSETLRFKIPAAGRTRRFDGITVMILPDSVRMHMAAKVAIERFEMVPR